MPQRQYQQLIRHQLCSKVMKQNKITLINQLILTVCINYNNQYSLLSSMSLRQKEISNIANSRIIMESLYSKQYAQGADIAKSRAMSISQSRSKVNELFQTSETCRLGQHCPSCSLKTNKLTYYSCCLLPACNSCYSGFHYLQCAKKIKFGINNESINHFYPQDHAATKNQSSNRCQRCEQRIESTYFSCLQCKCNLVCQKCCSFLHRAGKFKIHRFKKHEKDKSNTSISTIASNSQNNILICPLHNKLRNILTQTIDLVCSQCIGNMRQRKARLIEYQGQNALQILRTELEQLSLDINTRQISHRNKWAELKIQLKEQFSKIYQIVQQRYEQNLVALNQMEEFDINILNKALKQSNKALTQSSIDYKQLGIPKELVIARLSIIGTQLEKAKANVVNSELFIHKIVGVQSQKLQSLMKSFTISKLKLRQEQNMSVKKLQKSIVNPNPSNLSVSRRSLSKSISKMENPRNSIIKQHSSISRSQNLSQQVCTQPVRNATPPNIKSQISSDKKSAILRQNSLMTAKLQDITPVALNFDLKETNASRINFISSKTQDYNENAFNENNMSSQSRTSKRKSDYFELRDRIRKPNIVSNRFSKR